LLEEESGQAFKDEGVRSQTEARSSSSPKLSFGGEVTSSAKNDTLSSILTCRSSSSAARTGNVALGKSDRDDGIISALTDGLPMQAMKVARLRKGCLPICVTQVILLLAMWGLTNPGRIGQADDA
jgi:hypothetical protein